MLMESLGRGHGAAHGGCGVVVGRTVDTVVLVVMAGWAPRKGGDAYIN